jgi:alpha-mannosidase
MTIREPEEHFEPRLLDVRLVVHTHWDREWYRPFPQFRARLVPLIDGILEGSAGTPFLLDGQAVVLEDYLELRPERAADVSNALRQGELEAGPWYVLADSLIPSGEGLVRNLLAGRRVLRSLRAAPPDVLYCPDSFGHPAFLPAIAAGFACESVVLWRGYGGGSHPRGDTANWIAPDGSSVVLYHLTPDGYEFGSHLPPESGAARDRWNAMRDVFQARATTGLVLLPAGADHHAPQANLDVAIGALKDVAQPDTIERSTLAQFGRALLERAQHAALPAVKGELRDSYGYTWTLQGTLSSRSELKRLYAQAERLLVRDVEPWAAHSRFRGDGVDRRALVNAAWRPVLLSQPHDTLCGCSVDDVALAMSARLADATAAAEEIRDTAVMALLGHHGNAARRKPDEWSPVVVVRNAAPRTRSGVAEIDVDLVLDDAPVGPASAGIEPRGRRTGPVSIGDPSIPLQELARGRTFAREEASRHYPWNRLVERRRVLAWVDDIPPLGLLTLPLEEKRRRLSLPSRPVSATSTAIIGGGTRIEAHTDRLSFVAESTSADWIAIEAEGERGDLYTRSAITGTRTLATLLRSRTTARGPLRAELTCDWRIVIPERRLMSAAGTPRKAASARMDIRTVIQLDAGAPFARIRVTGDNNATDVRLRIGVRTGLQSARTWADSAFGPLLREPIAAGPAERVKETPPSTAPLHRYVSTFDDARGATLFSDGLAEYEADADGTIWVTLLRAVGELSRHNLPERPGHAGYPVLTPAAQSLGPFEANLAFALHGGRSTETIALIDGLAEDVLLPLRGETWRTAIHPPRLVAGAELSGTGLAFSAVKESDDGEWLVLRCVNLLDQPVRGTWHLAGLNEAVRARLDETPLEPVAVREGRIEFVAPARAAVTILAR